MFKTGYVCIFYHSFHFVYRLESCNKYVVRHVCKTQSASSYQFKLKKSTSAYKRP